jgi:hypothetical protein
MFFVIPDVPHARRIVDELEGAGILGRRATLN